ncbi:MAG: SpoIIE family protein phosphatase [Candidatus Methanoperedens sp.]|nr:SpoIIE family protein phosphatase [Candidatus Methanoperedens sp.]MCZ7358787.1 SpoIIE family protein phosphatase [Candidatus Methanoperedens sp.]HLB69430.1 SpoIIE family protein phosphatase [Candidatus Methanoperedens sp.]
MAKMKFGIASRPRHGCKYNGDTVLIKEFDSKVLISMIDGLGHGEFAAVASSRCKKCIEEHYESGFSEIFRNCDLELRKTNGVVMGMMFIDFEQSSITYAGVGNISARLLGTKPVHFISRDGIVGYRLPKIREYKHPYINGDTILLYSDGISSRVVKYSASMILKQDVQATADEILKLYGKDEDDATVIVAR